MIPPVRALVRPRVVSPETGDVLLLADEFADWLDDIDEPALELVGGPGQGKTTALEHLAAACPTPGVLFFDEPDAALVRSTATSSRVVYTAVEPLRLAVARSLRLASWTDDEAIEYLLAARPRDCAAVIERVRRASDRRRLHGVPELWRVALDAMADDSSLAGPLSALQRHLYMQAGGEAAWLTLGRDCLPLLADKTASIGRVVASSTVARIALGRHRLARVLAAANYLTRCLETAQPLNYYYGQGKDSFSLAWNLPVDLVEEIAVLVAGSPTAQARLSAILRTGREADHREAANILHSAAIGWRPERHTAHSGVRPKLDNARLMGAQWPRVDLAKVSLKGADLSNADLTGARLGGAVIIRANFTRASLTTASVTGANADFAIFSNADLSQATALYVDFRHANFVGANLRGAALVRCDLSHADLSRADLRGADLAGAKLNEATVDGADLRGANFASAMLAGVALCRAELSGAVFREAELCQCDLEGISSPNANFRAAKLVEAYLTGSSLPRADLRGANLRKAGLADIHWPGADLRQANFADCSFHLGSSRSGLVGSPIACEGSRTGFYTDDFNEQDFKSPEEIRKADLRGADLRGAQTNQADFYLVDLRGAQYSPEQAAHFRQCGAILFDRVSG
jgi:uncharacterized protein YjbI with pentapeptide repeats